MPRSSWPTQNKLKDKFSLHPSLRKLVHGTGNNYYRKPHPIKIRHHKAQSQCLHLQNTLTNCQHQEEHLCLNLSSHYLQVFSETKQ
ncbi:rCG55687, isoform CRA_b [Rattus norvegicus]|uniref:RCG55687, isoform CRA_b n=1 Tax=Rattus norvegicus TaxID=10116 RepID=A6JR50_RAT|nr:rCG55687, isoform CRA_b [Rattus norvegicus]